MQEPGCEMPWDIYLDWLQDQGNDDLRDINYASLICSKEFRLYHSMHNFNARGEGYNDNFGYFENREDDFSPFEGDPEMGGHWGQGPMMYFFPGTGIEISDIRGNGSI
jgi:hypothetical protein